ncbi:MAG: hypothetical protein HQL17_06060 [Candidatus Omnitrophica bacterium]|nr:hypothetical protein [Candidatus Omnitrophota bacterium]
MRTHVFCRGQNVIEYILLVTAVIVVLIAGILAKNNAGDSLLGGMIEKNVGVTEKFLKNRDTGIQFKSASTGADIASSVARGH